jgi:hypothetical protein
VFPLQLIPSVTAVLVHAPLVQASVLQSLPSSHGAHAAPALPQALADVPATHAVPFQHPVQQLLA